MSSRRNAEEGSVPLCVRGRHNHCPPDESEKPAMNEEVEGLYTSPARKELPFVDFDCESL